MSHFCSLKLFKPVNKILEINKIILVLVLVLASFVGGHIIREFKLVSIETRPIAHSRWTSSKVNLMKSGRLTETFFSNLFPFLVFFLWAQS
jgi:hypothetical protein